MVTTKRTRSVARRKPRSPSTASQAGSGCCAARRLPPPPPPSRDPAAGRRRALARPRQIARCRPRPLFLLGEVLGQQRALLGSASYRCSRLLGLLDRSLALRDRRRSPARRPVDRPRAGHPEEHERERATEHRARLQHQPPSWSQLDRHMKALCAAAPILGHRRAELRRPNRGDCSSTAIRSEAVAAKPCTWTVCRRGGRIE